VQAELPDHHLSLEVKDQTLYLIPSRQQVVAAAERQMSSGRQGQLVVQGVVVMLQTKPD
jgi:hypothetical protein